MAIMSAHWIWRLIGDEQRNAARLERPSPPPMKIQVERLPDYLWGDLGFPRPRRDEDDRPA